MSEAPPEKRQRGVPSPPSQQLLEIVLKHCTVAQYPGGLDYLKSLVRTEGVLSGEELDAATNQTELCGALRDLPMMEDIRDRKLPPYNVISRWQVPVDELKADEGLLVFPEEADAGKERKHWADKKLKAEIARYLRPPVSLTKRQPEERPKPTLIRDQIFFVIEDAKHGFNKRLLSRLLNALAEDEWFYSGTSPRARRLASGNDWTIYLLVGDKSAKRDPTRVEIAAYSAGSVDEKQGASIDLVEVRRKYQGQNLCRLLVDHVFRYLLETHPDLTKIALENTAGWRGLACYFSAALDNGLLPCLKKEGGEDDKFVTEAGICPSDVVDEEHNILFRKPPGKLEEERSLEI